MGSDGCHFSGLLLGFGCTIVLCLELDQIKKERIYTYFHSNGVDFLVLMANYNSMIRKLKIVSNIRHMFRFFFKSYRKDLPDEIMELILPRLCIIDYMRCRHVCRSWRAAVDRAIAAKLCPPSPQPWLLLDSRRPLYIVDGYSLVCLSERETQKSKPSRSYAGPVDCVASIDGWLIMAMIPEDGSNWTSVNFFLNPLSGDTVMLPSKAQNSNIPTFIRKAVASSIPTNQHCIVAGLCFRNKLYLCRHTDESWTLIDDTAYKDIEIVDDKLYAVASTRSGLMVFSIREVHDGGPLAYTAERLPFWPNLVDDSRYETRNMGRLVCWNVIDPYLAKGSAPNEVFLVLAEVRGRSSVEPACNKRSTRTFRVLKLDCNANGCEWEEVFDLGDQILFLSRCSSKFIDVSGGGFRSCPDETLNRNSIYFAFRNELGVFSMSDRHIKYLTLPKNHPDVRQSIWFTPNPW